MFHVLDPETRWDERYISRILTPFVRPFGKQSLAEFVNPFSHSPAGTISRSPTMRSNAHDVSHSTDCRHVFCAMCLLSWWQTKQENSFPICRTISKSPPVRDPVQGYFAALVRAQADEEEESGSFDTDIFETFFPPKA